MSSLRGIFGGRIAARTPKGAAACDVQGGFRLPVPVRRAGRQFLRFAQSMPRLRNGTGHAAAVAFVSAFWFYGAAVGGTASQFVAGTAATLGLKTTDIIITGQVETTEQAVFSALDLGPSLVGFDVDRARERVLALPWVKDVAIRKVYPGKLTVSLAERRAMAVWQVNDKMTVVEQSGETIARFGIADLINDRFAHLPHLVGEGAAQSAHEILPIAARHPQIAGRVKAYIRVGQRRWDLQMVNGVIIKLPEHGADKALSEVAGLATGERLLERELTVVDMRLADRIVLRLDEAAAQTRADFVSARLKAMKKADRKL
ncbi:MAG: cell division protein FtsQ/DivIB [Pseudomonadota bacterium]